VTDFAAAQNVGANPALNKGNKILAWFFNSAVARRKGRMVMSRI
jgi:hypothetical protein